MTEETNSLATEAPSDHPTAQQAADQLDDLLITDEDLEDVDEEFLITDDGEVVGADAGELEEDFGEVDVQVNREVYEDGRWFRVSAFGDEARAKIAGLGCERWQDLMTKVRNKHAGRDGMIPPKKAAKLTPQIQAQALMLDIQKVDLVQACERLNRHQFRAKLDADGKPTGVVLRKEKGSSGAWEWKEFKVPMEGGYVSPTTAGRRLFLMALAPEASDVVHRIASSRKRFDCETDEAEVRGN